MTSTTTTTTTTTLTALSTLRVDGIGPLRVGMTADEVRSAAGLELTLLEGPVCDELGSSSQIPSLHLVLIDDQLALITVDGSPIQTDAGLRVGSSEAEVIAASSGDVENRNPGTSEHWVVVRPSEPSSPAVSMVFQVRDGVVQRIRAGRRTSTESDEPCA